MALDRRSLEFLAHSRTRGVDFSSCATIGRQGLGVSARDLREVCEIARCPITDEDAERLMDGGWLDPVLRQFGTLELSTIDVSDYEGATYLHDLNSEIPSDLVERFTAVLDIGSLEHIFNVPIALCNYMRMVRNGGHLLLVLPTNNEAGHGFYQFSPELFYRALSPEYGFQIEGMYLLESGRRHPRWYVVMDPGAVGLRGQFRSRAATHLFIQARRIGPYLGFQPFPQQSDYAVAWNAGHHPGAAGPLRRFTLPARQRLPRIWKDPLIRLRQVLFPNLLHRRPDYRVLRMHFKPIANQGVKDRKTP